MTELPVFYTTTEVGQTLGVGKSTISGWKVRYPDSVPTPSALTGHGMDLYSEADLDKWKEWRVGGGGRRMHVKEMPECPVCKAKPDQVCVSTNSGLPRMTVHRERLKR